jgi:cell wall-associated NlpC family hydrolase
MGKIRRGGFVFLSWTGDHAPRHVHVYCDGKLVLKWDLENRTAMKGKASRRLLRIIAELEEEGQL